MTGKTWDPSLTKYISTHTPAWGVTYIHHNLLYLYLISTHTPAWGVTISVCNIKRYTAISTHTPAWGVTDFPGKFLVLLLHFNSHARVGRDCSGNSVLHQRLAFQLTRPRGA